MLELFQQTISPPFERLNRALRIHAISAQEIPPSNASLEMHGHSTLRIHDLNINISYVNAPLASSAYQNLACANTAEREESIY
jgi:hypothetical protein